MAARDPRQVAARELARRDRSARELRARLEAAGIDAAGASATVAWLEAAGYVDDARLAGRRAARLAERGYGDAAIDARLAGEGIARREREAAIAALEPERERALRLAAAAARRTGRSLAALLGRRGFAEESIEAALDGEA